MKLRFLATIMGTTLIVLATILIPLTFYLQNASMTQTVTELEKSALSIAARSSGLLWESTADRFDFVDSIVRAYADASGSRVIVTDATGSTVVTTDESLSSLGADYSTRPEIEAALSGSIASGKRFSSELDTELLYVAVPVFSGDEVIGAVRLTYPANVVEDRVSARVSLLGVVTASAVALAAIVAWILAGSVIRPLRALTETADAIATGRARVSADESTGSSEIRTLAKAFNRMSTRLASLADEQRRFAADASHQLRTPLTALRLRLESARSVLTDHPERADARLGAAEEELDRLNAMIESLLVLSRGEADDAKVVDVDAATIVAETVAAWIPLADERGIRLVHEGPAAGIHARAVDRTLDSVVGNLIDNAFAAGSAGDTVVVKVSSQADERVVIAVTDTGRGITSEHAERAFDRFWRGDATSAGTGIGLSVARRLIEAAGGKVRLSQNTPRGAIATITLVAAPSR